MAELHFLNVRNGDSTLVFHASGRLSMVDISCGNLVLPVEEARKSLAKVPKALGNFRMCERPTNPLSYIKEHLYGLRPFRFILSHPDMDHLDGFDALLRTFGINNFWDCGIRRDKPDFDDSPYLEEDWDRYSRVIDGKEGITVISPRSGSRFKYANTNEDDSGGGDGLHILAPNQELIDNANTDGDINDASFVILYRSVGGRILLPGDAHDHTWEHVLTNYRSDIANCPVLLAPHHGRKSGRSYDFLDVVKPQLTLFGCAPSEHLAHDAWHKRDLPILTNNQAGNIVLDLKDNRIDVYVQNEIYAQAAGGNTNLTNRQGYYYLRTLHSG